jgi:hypothetical protein
MSTNTDVAVAESGGARKTSGILIRGTVGMFIGFPATLVFEFLALTSGNLCGAFGDSCDQSNADPTGFYILVRSP